VIAARGGEEANAVDRADFVALVEPLLPAAYRLAVAMLHSQIEAEDAVQEAAFKAWRRHDRFKTGAEMKPWLLAFVANECRRVRRNRWSSVLKWPAGPETGSLAPGDDATSAEGLRRGIQQLPHEQKLAVILRYYLDLSFDDMAQVLKTTPKAAKSRTYRALERLRLNPEVIADERD
jgi:RNA polymerase sigma-70 factor, ECF subfamily